IAARSCERHHGIAKIECRALESHRQRGLGAELRSWSERQSLVHSIARVSVLPRLEILAHGEIERKLCRGRPSIGEPCRGTGTVALGEMAREVIDPGEPSIERR